MSLKFSQNSLENACAGSSFIIMLQAVASVPCRKNMKDKILTHVPAFLLSNSFLFCLLAQCSDLPFGNFILYLHCGVCGVDTIANYGCFFEKRRITKPPTNDPTTGIQPTHRPLY